MPLISSVRGSYGAQGRFGKKGLSFRMGQSNTFPGKSAKEILVDWQSGLTAAAFGASTPPDGAYWIQPPGCPEPFQVHCYMSIEGGGWNLVLRIADDDFGPATTSGFASNTPLVGDWSGWGLTTKAQIDSLGYNYTTANGTETFTPVFAYSPFNDVMVISGRSGQQSKRVGWRHTSTISNMYSVTGGTSNRTVADSTLFGNPTNWLQSGMDIRSDTTPGSDAGTNRKVGFKINGDGANDAVGTLTGGNPSGNKGWALSMIGYGRDDTTEGRSGGGIGCLLNVGNHRKMGHHYWGWGSGRASQFWSGDTSSPWFGHAVYVRELNTLTGSVPL